MKTTVIHFEDLIDEVARELYELFRHQYPGIANDPDLSWRFVSYIEPKKDDGRTPKPRSPASVAAEAASLISQDRPNRLILITDLCFTSSPTSPNGCDMLSHLATDMSTDHSSNLWVANVSDLVNHKEILVIFLTAYGLRLTSTIQRHSAWRGVHVRVVNQPKKLTVPNALKEIAQEGPVVVYVDRGIDKPWTVNLIAQWIRRP